MDNNGLFVNAHNDIEKVCESGLYEGDVITLLVIEVCKCMTIPKDSRPNPCPLCSSTGWSMNSDTWKGGGRNPNEPLLDAFSACKKKLHSLSKVMTSGERIILTVRQTCGCKISRKKPEKCSLCSGTGYDTDSKTFISKTLVKRPKSLSKNKLGTSRKHGN